jgi:hypothetical protein
MNLSPTWIVILSGAKDPREWTEVRHPLGSFSRNCGIRMTVTRGKVFSDVCPATTLFNLL